MFPDSSFRAMVAHYAGRIIINNHVQVSPNKYNNTLVFPRPWEGVERYADISTAGGRWFLLFEYSDPLREGCKYHLQENTDIDGPDGIIDHYQGDFLSEACILLRDLLKA